MIDPEVTSLHTAFVIIYLQELAWISAPLLISANVFLHACLRNLEVGILIFSGSIFAFFLVSGIFISVSLYFVHSRALARKQVRYLTPYIVAKLFRMLVLGTFTIVILFSPKLIRTYFYASIYGVFECVAGAIALEACNFKKQTLTEKDRICAAETTIVMRLEVEICESFANCHIQTRQSVVQKQRTETKKKHESDDEGLAYDC